VSEEVANYMREANLHDGAGMSRQLVTNLTRRGVPDVNHAISRARGHHGTIRSPVGLDQVALKIVLSTMEHLEEPI